ncbi:MAG: UDP-N-acetylmuramoyl-L-alanine--D-glutamate ligase [Chloroflexi bacterium]|nr:UDP-N-acetylmuramoyl-L-alanine--D-glutamate ligase [Chloroflexota bacterium]
MLKRIDVYGQRALILGLGREGTATARYLAQRGARVTVSDQQDAQALQGFMEQLADLPVRYVLGGHPETLLPQADVIYVSPGVPQQLPLLVEARRRGIPIESQTRMTFQLCRAPLIGITGSSGKSTTAALVAEILRADGRQVHLGGNIGTPLLEIVEEIPPQAWVVMELSSFQLETLQQSPHIAAVLNLSPNHLDRHRSMEAYLQAKANILRYQSGDDHAILGWDDARARSLSSEVRGRLSYFSRAQEVEWGAFLRGEWIVVRSAEGQSEVVRAAQVPLLGEHNLWNVLAACAIAAAARARVASMATAIQRFPGLEHRLEWVGEYRGVRYYNDSIATSPQRATAALRAFVEPIVLVAGGREKHLPWEEFAELVMDRTRAVVLFGEATESIARAIEGARQRSGGSGPVIRRATNLELAVELANSLAQPGDVVLLAPACTSFDLYRDFEERGQHFKTLVRALGETA